MDAHGGKAMAGYDWEGNAEAIEAVAARSPLACPWGFFSGPRSAGTTVRVFQWFASPHELLTWLQKGEPRRHFEDAATVERIAAAVRPAVEVLEARGGSELTEEIMAAAIAPLSDVLAVEWWGRFDHLRAGGSAFAAGVRQDFRESGSEPGDDPSAPISDEEVDAFVDFLSLYGL